MGKRRKHATELPAPYLGLIGWARPDEARPKEYPFSLAFLDDPGWNIEFTTPVTIIMGEKGSGKSTLTEAIAGLAGYDQTGGGKGYRPVDHRTALAVSGTLLAGHLRAAWLPKITPGWFFRAETFWAVARYLDDLPGGGPDFLSCSHGEGFLRVFAERCGSQGFYLMEEPESALSPARQMDLVELLADIQGTGPSQVILSTHSPILMAVPVACLRQLTRFGIEEVALGDTRHCKLYCAFYQDPHGVIRDELRERRTWREADGA